MNSIAGGSGARGWLWVLIAISVLPGLGMWFFHGLLPDEAYYWVWGENLQWSYFDHPPAIAWLIRASVWLLGDFTGSVRLAAVVAWVVTAACIYDMARRLTDSAWGGLLTLTLWSALPIVQAGLHIVTPDSPLAAFSALTYWMVFRIFWSGSRKLWLLVGLLTGAALLSKYIAVILPAVLLLVLLGDQAGRRCLGTRWPWLGLGLAVLLFVPVITWNAAHNWASFAFQLHHGLGGHAAEVPVSVPQEVAAPQDLAGTTADKPGQAANLASEDDLPPLNVDQFDAQESATLAAGVVSAITSLLTFLVVQWVVAIPWVWLGMLGVALAALAPRKPQPGARLHGGNAVPDDAVLHRTRRLLAWGFLVPSILFATASLAVEGEANWAMVAYIPGIVLLGDWVTRLHNGLRRLGRLGFWLVLVGTVLIPVVLANALRFPALVAQIGLPLPEGRTQLTHAYGWDDVAARAEALRLELVLRDGFPAGCALMAANYQDASMLAWYLDRPHGIQVREDARISQYTLWQREGRWAEERPCLYLQRGNEHSEIPPMASPMAGEHWPLTSLWSQRNPDLTQRWFGLFVAPRTPQVPEGTGR